ncbi:MAG: type II secretion system F family protein [Planctomycetes bacterium]|nr:type II secretion system F family protein [Planctomycetota bacterium]
MRDETPDGGSTTTNIRLGPDDVQYFNRQIAQMARLNMPFSKGLEILARDVTDTNFRTLLEMVQQDLDEGRPLETALARHPETFTHMMLEVIRAGESSGNLALILEELNAHTEAMKNVRNKIVEAIIYPSVICALVLGFVMFFMLMVVPQFEGIILERGSFDDRDPRTAARLKELQLDDPQLSPRERMHLLALEDQVFATRYVIKFSRLLREPACFVVFVAFFGVAIALTVRKLIRMGSEYDDMLFRLPLFGGLFEAAALMKVTRTMRDLLANGVSMVESLRLVSNTVGKNRIQAKLTSLREAVEEGGSFARNLEGGGVFPESMVWKLQLAEEKGMLEEALQELSTEFEIAVARKTTVITNFATPVMLAGTGAIVFVLFAACFLPLLNFSAV